MTTPASHAPSSVWPARNRAAVRVLAVGVILASMVTRPAPHDDHARVHVFEPNVFTSEQAIARSSDVVVVGEVVSVETAGFAEEIHTATEIVGVTVANLETLDGKWHADEVTVAWDGFVVAPESHEREQEIVVDGLALPHRGQSLLLFLVEASPTEQAAWQGVSHTFVSYDGVFQVVDGLLRSANVPGGMAEKWRGQPVDALIERVRSS